jgi:hypothetical protein
LKTSDSGNIQGKAQEPTTDNAQPKDSPTQTLNPLQKPGLRAYPKPELNHGLRIRPNTMTQRGMTVQKNKLKLKIAMAQWVMG